MAHEEFVTFETAKLLKMAGFPQEGRRFFNDEEEYIIGEKPRTAKIGEYVAPTQAQATSWLGEKHDMYINVEYSSLAEEWRYTINDLETLFTIYPDLEHPRWTTDEMAIEAGIQKACQILND